MANMTALYLTVVESGNMTPKQVNDALKDIYENMELDEANLSLKDRQICGTDEGDDGLETCVEMSKKYPDLLFDGHVDGTLDVPDDLRNVRIRNGKMETVEAKITYPPFKELLTEEEKSGQQPNQLNRMEIIGIVGRKFTKEVEGKRIGYLAIATNYGYKNARGQAVIETMWHEVVLNTKELRQKAENIGICDRVHIIGRLRVRHECGAAGEQTFGEIVARTIEVIGNENMILPFQKAEN